MLQSSMRGEVVAFRPGVLRTRSDADEDVAERGRILLFTGVRYERMVEPSEDAQSRSAADDQFDGSAPSS